MKSSTVACALPVAYPISLPDLPFLTSFFPPLPFFSDKQHICFCITLGGELCPRPEMVDVILSPEPGVQKRVLDVGTLPTPIPLLLLLNPSSLIFPSFPPDRLWEWYLVSISLFLYSRLIFNSTLF